jgi:archaellum component FlaC
MAEEKSYCPWHEKQNFRLDNLESNTKAFEEQVDERFKNLQASFNTEIDKIASRFEAKIEELTKLYNSLNNTIIKIELMFTEIKKDLDKMIQEKETLKRDTRAGILYPTIASIISMILGIIVGKLTKGL